ncbi:MAG: hypothetical protein C5B59_05960 [Bacteroidetes bacterium]|nr:MAG: hypothetical protein C5B59_05960 [Bacteroidota bacterium]
MKKYKWPKNEIKNSMSNQEHSLGSLFEKSHAYLETRIDLIRMKTVYKSSDVLSSAAAFLAILIGLLAFLATLSFGLAYFIGHLLGNTYYGFFIMAGFYALATLLIYIFRNQWIKTPIHDGIVKKILK